MNKKNIEYSTDSIKLYKVLKNNTRRQNLHPISGLDNAKGF